MKEKLKLSVLVSSLAVGGAEQLLLMLLKHIDHDRFVTRIFFLRDPGIVGREVIELGHETVVNILSNRIDLRGIPHLVHLFRKTRTDVLLLINHLNTLLYGVISARLAGVPACINWENETFKRYPIHSLTMFFRRVLHKGIDVVVAAAEGHKQYIAEVEKIPLQKIQVIYNGVDAERFHSSLTPQQAREKLGIPADSPVISILAVLRPDKAHEIFLDAATHIRRELTTAHFLVIGDGPQRSMLELRAAKMGLSDCVHFLGFRRELADILAAVDVNTLSSKPEQETLSVAAIEAMAAGIPIVCTDVGFMNEIVIPGQTGYLVPIGDAQTLADRVLEILRNPDLKRQMSAACRRLVEQKLSASHMADAFQRLFLQTYLRRSGHPENL